MLRFSILTSLFVTFFSFQVLGQYTIKNHSNLFPKKNTPLTCISQDKNGYLWFGSKEGLLKYDGKTAQIFNQKDGLPVNKITSIYQDSQ